MPVESSNFGRYANPGSRPVENMGHTTPEVELSDSQRPAVAFVPAPFLPAGRFDEHARANIVLSAGTPVALDVAGSIIPAGTPVGHAFKYTSLDSRTGLGGTSKRADTGASVTADVTAIMASGLGGDRQGFFLEPVGAVSYNAFQFEGAVEGTWPAYTVDYDNPSKFPLHQTQKQPETLVAITCDYTFEYPYIWGRNLLSDQVKIFDNSSDEVDVVTANAKSYPFAHDELIRNAGAAVFGSGVELVFISPNCGTGDTGLAGSGVMAGTAGAATFEADGGPGGTAASPGTAVDITAAGYHVLYDGTDTTRYIVVHTVTESQDGGAINVVGGGYTAGAFTFKGQDQIQPGDFVAARLGKLVKFDPDRMTEGDRYGQVLRVRTNAIKRDYTDRVKTAFGRAADPTHRMPGSATKGVPYLLNLVSDSAQVVLEDKKKLDGTTISATGLPSSLPLGSIVVNLLR